MVSRERCNKLGVDVFMTSAGMVVKAGVRIGRVVEAGEIEKDKRKMESSIVPL